MDIGLSRVTVHTPYRRLDVALPDRTPVAELLPELLRHAGAPPAEEPGGWLLRRTGGEPLSAARGLGDQQVPDGTVLHLVPERLRWTEPAHDDPAGQIAAAARLRSGAWDQRMRRMTALAAGALLLAGGLAVVVLRPSAAGPAVPAVVAAVLVAAAGYAMRRGAHPPTGPVLGGFALLYASAAGALAGGDLLVPAGAAGLLLASSAGIVLHRGAGVPAADRDRVGGYVAGATVALLGGAAGMAAGTWDATGAAALLACVLVCGVAALPAAALRLAGLPAPPAGSGTTAAPEVVRLAVARADHLLTGLLSGWSVLAVGVAGVLVTAGGPAGRLLAALTATALLLRSRVFVMVRQRLALLAGGVAGWMVVAGWLLTVTPDPALPAVVVAAAAGALAVAAGGATAAAPGTDVTVAGQAGGATATGPAGDGTVVGPAAGAPGWPAPVRERLAVVVDTLAVVGVVPLAAAVLGLYGDAVALMAAW